MTTNLDPGFRTLDHGAEQHIRQCAPAEGWIIAQSFTAIKFSTWPDFPLPFESIFSGRIFAESGEVRWLREGGRTQVWNLHDVPGAGYRRVSRDYYLWGTYKDGHCAEAVVPDLEPYPAPMEEPQEQDRPYITVYEYLPNPSEAVLPLGELMRELNRPRVAAHRFASFHCGRTPNG